MQASFLYAESPVQLLYLWRYNFVIAFLSYMYNFLIEFGSKMRPGSIIMFFFILDLPKDCEQKLCLEPSYTLKRVPVQINCSHFISLIQHITTTLKKYEFRKKGRDLENLAFLYLIIKVISVNIVLRLCIYQCRI